MCPHNNDKPLCQKQPMPEHRCPLPLEKMNTWVLRSAPGEVLLQCLASLTQPSWLLHLNNQNAEICEICLFQAGE